jgi:oxygen-independent coproporphyrinogen-3 oxidase
MNDKTLRLIGRDHTSKEIIDSYKMAKGIGIENINMDLIVGLPGEGVEDIKNTLRIIKELSPENITVHTLALKKGSDVINHLDNFILEDQNVIENMLEATKKFSEQNGYEPYYLYRQKNILGNFENIGYAKDGLECIYNISIMEEKETIIAAGVGSTSKVFYPDEDRLERIFNFRSINEYINRIDEVIERKRRVLS